MGAEALGYFDDTAMKSASTFNGVINKLFLLVGSEGVGVAEVRLWSCAKTDAELLNGRGVPLPDICNSETTAHKKRLKTIKIRDSSV